MTAFIVLAYTAGQATGSESSEAYDVLEEASGERPLPEVLL